MLIRFHIGDRDFDRELAIAKAFAAGAAQFGDHVQFQSTDWAAPENYPEADVGCCFWIKRESRRILDEYLAAGKRVLMFDKPLLRALSTEARSYFRVGIDGPTPIKYIDRAQRNSERWCRLAINIKPKRSHHTKRGHIIFAGSSQKYFDFHGLGDVNDYAARVFIDCIRRQKTPARQTIYRPKPSFSGYRDIIGTRTSRPPETLADLLAGAHILVTHGSAAALDAIFNGVPAVALGQCAATPVSGDLIDIENPWLPSAEKRFEFGSNLAYCQWTMAEMSTGEAWAFLRAELAATA